MSKLTILNDREDDWAVWISLRDEDAPEGLSFVIGCGETREKAIDDAREDLEQLIKWLISQA